MIKSTHARHETGMRFAVTTGGGGDGRPDEAGEVVVTDPGEDPDALGQRSLEIEGAVAGVTR